MNAACRLAQSSRGEGRPLVDLDRLVVVCSALRGVCQYLEPGTRRSSVLHGAVSMRREQTGLCLLIPPEVSESFRLQADGPATAATKDRQYGIHILLPGPPP